jgi:acetyl esterase/lipase
MDTAERLAGMTGATVVCTRRRSTFPEAFDDVRVAYRYAKQVGAVTVVGEQVGAGLAAGLLVHLRDLGRPLPRRAVLVSALLDLTMQANSLVLNSRADPSFNVKRLRQRAAEYAGNAVLTDPLLSPLYANLHGLPPLQLLVAGTDPLLDDSLAFATRAARSGVTVDLRVWSDRSTLVAESLNAMTGFIVAGGTRADAPARLSAVAG